MHIRGNAPCGHIPFSIVTLDGCRGSFLRSIVTGDMVPLLKGELKRREYGEMHRAVCGFAWVSFVPTKPNVSETRINGSTARCASFPGKGVCEIRQSVISFDETPDTPKFNNNLALEDGLQASRTNLPNEEPWFRRARDEYVAKPIGHSF